MPVTAKVNPGAGLPVSLAALYHVGNIEDDAGDLMTPSEAASITAIAGQVRARILSGGYPDGRVESRAELAARHRISNESAGVVLRLLRDEGLVDLRQGSGTYVRPLRSYSVWVTAPGPRRGPERRRVERRMAAAERAEAAVSLLRLDVNEDVWTWSMSVRSADPARAGLIGHAVAARTAGEGWDLSEASIRVEVEGI